MLDGLLGGLIVAWILSLFNFEEIMITALYEFFGISISVHGYYFIFAIIGLIGGLGK